MHQYYYQWCIRFWNHRYQLKHQVVYWPVDWCVIIWSKCFLLFTTLNTNQVKMMISRSILQSVSWPDASIITLRLIIVESNIKTIRSRILLMSQLFFVKRDLTGPMGIVRHYRADIVNSAINELVQSSTRLSRMWVNSNSHPRIIDQTNFF